MKDFVLLINYFYTILYFAVVSYFYFRRTSRRCNDRLDIFTHASLEMDRFGQNLADEWRVKLDCPCRIFSEILNSNGSSYRQ